MWSVAQETLDNAFDTDVACIAADTYKADTVNGKKQGEIFTDFLSPAIRYMLLGMSRKTWSVRTARMIFLATYVGSRMGSSLGHLKKKKRLINKITKE